MIPIRNFLSAILLASGFIGGLPGGAAGQNALPGSLGETIARAARHAEDDRIRLRETQGGIGRSRLATQRDRQVADRVAPSYAATVNAAIARNPAHVDAIVTRAVAAVPWLKDDVVASARAAFPVFADRIEAAAHGNANAPVPTRRNGESAGAPRTDAPDSGTETSADGPPPDSITISQWDPIEPVNRAVFFLNRGLEDYLIGPIALGYSVVTPDVLERSVRNVFRNAKEPAAVLNKLLQLDFTSAGRSFTRLAVNSTVGGLGFLDVAAKMGLPFEAGDFGQTLGYYGVPAGPYVVLPVLGGRNLRHAFGTPVDVAAYPPLWLIGSHPDIALGLTAGDLMTKQAERRKQQRDVRSQSDDWYETRRTLYYEARKGTLAPVMERRY